MADTSREIGRDRVARLDVGVVLRDAIVDRIEALDEVVVELLVEDVELGRGALHAVLLEQVRYHLTAKVPGGFTGVDGWIDD